MDFKAHFASFCTGDNQSCSYEDWIDALTSSQQMNDDDSSSNASSSTTSAPTDILLDFEGMAKVIDPKYYSEDCEERKFWDENVAGSGRTEVAARQSDESLTADSSSAMADFMSPVVDAASTQATKEVAGDLLSFD